MIFVEVIIEDEIVCHLLCGWNRFGKDAVSWESFLEDNSPDTTVLRESMELLRVVGFPQRYVDFC